MALDRLTVTVCSTPLSLATSTLSALTLPIQGCPGTETRSAGKSAPMLPVLPARSVTPVNVTRWLPLKVLPVPATMSQVVDLPPTAPTAVTVAPVPNTEALKLALVRPTDSLNTTRKVSPAFTVEPAPVWLSTTAALISCVKAVSSTKLLGTAYKDLAPLVSIWATKFF